MKRKRPEQQERRRPLADLNLVGETRRQAVRRRGCASLFGSILLLGAAAVTVAGSAHRPRPNRDSRLPSGPLPLFKFRRLAPRLSQSSQQTAVPRRELRQPYKGAI